MRLPRLAAAALLVSSALVVLAPLPASAASARFHVDCSAKSAGDGSTGKPWNSLGGVNGHGPFQPGEQILLKRGTTCRGQLQPAGSGAAGQPIVLGAYGSGRLPVVAGGGTPNLSGAIDLRNQSHWTIQDLRVTNTAGQVSTQEYRAGVSIRNLWGGALPGILVQRLVVENVASAPNDLGGRSREWGGITVGVDGGANDSFPGLTVKDNVVKRVGRSGIMVANWTWPAAYNENVRITGNTVSFARGDGIVVYGARYSRMDHNVVDNANDQFPCPLCGGVNPGTANAGLWSIRSTDLRIDHNEVSRTKEPGGDGEGFDLDWDSERIVFEYNYSHDNEGGGLLFCGSKDVDVRFNIFENNRRAAFNFIQHAPSTGTRIYNNTVYTKRMDGTKALRSVNGGNTSSVEFFNNVVYNRADGWWQWPSDDVRTSANTLVGNHGDGAPADSKTSRKDPGLRKPGSGGDGFRTLSGYKPRSPKTMQRGVAIPADVTRDFFGKRIDPKRPPRGAAG